MSYLPKTPLRERELAIYLAIWRKTYRDPSRLSSITFPKKTNALSFRMLMYRAIKPYRNGVAIPPDEELTAASEVLQIAVEGSIATISERKTLGILEGLLGEIGLTEEDISGVKAEPAANAALDRIMAEIKGLQSGVDNPFKTKGSI